MNQEVDRVDKFAYEHELESAIKRRREKRKRYRSKKTSAEKRRIRNGKVEKKRLEEVYREDFVPTKLAENLVKEAIKLQKRARKKHHFYKVEEEKKARKFLTLALEKIDEARALLKKQATERPAFETLYREVIIQQTFLITK